jgi:hypothetical protein
MSICLVLGAGASLANAQHFRPVRRRDSHPPLDTTFFETLQARGILLSPMLRAYARNLLGEEPSPDILQRRRMEDFFKDLFFDFQESPGNSDLRTAYADLIDLYVRVIRETTNWLCADGRRGGPVGRLLAAAADRSESLTVLTFNHDLVIENEIFRRGRLRPRWCIREGYGGFAQGLDHIESTAAVPRFPQHGADCDHSAPITILKLHGSLNWFVRIQGDRPTARILSGQGGERTVHLLTARTVRGRPPFKRTDSGRGRTSWNIWPVIIPPIYAKQAFRRVVQVVWDEARQALEQSSRLVFFGYSLPQLDIEAEKLFERSIASNANLRWTDVINPAPAAAQRYAALAPRTPVRWYPSVESFMASASFEGS